MTDSPRLIGRSRVQPRALSLGSAVPLRRSFDASAEPVEPVTPKTAEEFRAESEERRDGRPMSTSCGFCDWRFEGTAGACRDAAVAHRGAEHPAAANRVGRGRGRGIGTWQRDQRNSGAIAADRAEANRVRGEREDADRLANIERGRKRDALAAMDAGEPQDREEQSLVGPHLDAEPLVPQLDGSPPPARPTTHDEGTRMEEVSTNSRAKKWPIERAIAAVQAVAAEVGRTPTIGQMVERGYTFAPSCTKLGLPTWSRLCAQAGLEPNRRGGATRSGREPQAGNAGDGGDRPPFERAASASGTAVVEASESSRPEKPLPIVEVESSPDDDEQPASDSPASHEVAKPEAALAIPTPRDPIRTAAIPYDAELLDDEADFLVRRAAALRQMASAIRVLAEPRERAA